MADEEREPQDYIYCRNWESYTYGTAEALKAEGFSDKELDTIAAELKLRGRSIGDAAEIEQSSGEPASVSTSTSAPAMPVDAEE